MTDTGSDSFTRHLRALLPPQRETDVHSPLVLAYVGDAVFELAVRAYLATHIRASVGELHERARDKVRAAAQAQALADIEWSLTEEERELVRRARNAKAQVPKSASLYEYRYSTAFEALLGHLFLTGRLERLVHLLDLVIPRVETEA